MDGKDQVRLRSFTRRTVLMSAGAFGVFGLLFGRLYQLQVLEADQYRMKADENRIKVRLLAPLRGRIVDRFGQELAGNRQNLRVLLTPEDTDNLEVDEVLDELDAIIGLPDGRRARVLQEVRRNAKFVPVTVAENLTWSQFAQINLRSPDLPGVHPDVGDTRFYPFAEELSHLVGYVGAVSEEDLDDDPLLRLPGFRVGKNGVERRLDTGLRGTSGTRQVEVNARGRVIRELDRSEGSPGLEAVLTLDMNVQRAAVKALEGQSGGAALLDVHTGELISLVSVPGFDPNAFSRGLSKSEWNDLISNEYKPLINKAIQGQYPPGSTVKPIVALAALEHGVMGPSETVTCLGHTMLGNHRFHCWKRGGHGVVDMHDGIKHSCDIYFYEVARRLGADRLAEVFKKFGLGETSGLEIANEKAGLVPTTGWKRAVTGKPWVMGETYNVGIGQGYLLATPLQLALMTARIANGGRQVEPRVIRSVGSELQIRDTTAEQLTIDPAHVALVKRAMDAVSNDIRGTGFGARLDEEGMSMAGKTGTAQVRRITEAERRQGVRKNEDLPWRLRDHALFVGYGPVENPKYAVAVIVEHGGSGSKAAAPVARDIMRAAQHFDPASKTPVGPRTRLRGGTAVNNGGPDKSGPDTSGQG